MSAFRGSFELYFGPHGIEELSTRMSEKSYETALVVFDAVLEGSAGLGKVFRVLQDANLRTFSQRLLLNAEPSYDLLDALTASCKDLVRSPDLIVGVGGGSAMDIAKGLAVTLPGPTSSSIDYRGMNKVRHRSISTLLVPSTAGSGSEMTYTASMIDDSTHTKLGINGDNVFPTYALHLPDFLLEAPDRVVVGSALDVLVHATEAISSSLSTAFTDPYAALSVQQTLENLPNFLSKRERGKIPSSEAAALLAASSQAGLAMLNSSGGMASAISYPVGALFAVPHGYAGGIPLPYVLREEELAGKSRTQELGLPERLSEVIFEMYATIGAPLNFADWSVPKESGMLIRERVIEEKSGSLALSPLGVDVDALERVVGSVLGL